MLNLVTIDSLPFVFNSQLQELSEEFDAYVVRSSEATSELEADIDVRGCWSSDSSSDKNEKATYLEMKHVYDVIQRVMSCRDKDLCVLMDWTPMLPKNHPCLHKLAQDIMNHILSPVVNHHWHVSLKSNPNYSLQRVFQEESDIYMSHIMGLSERLENMYIYSTGKRSFKVEKCLVDYIQDDLTASRLATDLVRKWLLRWISEYSMCPG